jgi:hypothetical protein
VSTIQYAHTDVLTIGSLVESIGVYLQQHELFGTFVQVNKCINQILQNSKCIATQFEFQIKTGTELRFGMPGRICMNLTDINKFYKTYMKKIQIFPRKSLLLEEESKYKEYTNITKIFAAFFSDLHGPTETQYFSCLCELNIYNVHLDLLILHMTINRITSLKKIVLSHVVNDKKRICRELCFSPTNNIEHIEIVNTEIYKISGFLQKLKTLVLAECPELKYIDCEFYELKMFILAECEFLINPNAQVNKILSNLENLITIQIVSDGLLNAHCLKSYTGSKLEFLYISVSNGNNTNDLDIEESNKIYAELIKNNSQLEDVHIEDHSINSDIFNHLSKLECLTRVYLESDKIDSVFGVFLKLKYLCVDMGHNELKFLGGVFLSLNVLFLNISNIQTIDPELDLASLVSLKIGKQLTKDKDHSQYTNDMLFNPESLTSVLKGCPNLTKLVIPNINVTDKVLTTIQNTCKKLEYFDITNCNTPTESVFKFFIDNTALKSINISNVHTEDMFYFNTLKYLQSKKINTDKCFECCYDCEQHKCETCDNIHRNCSCCQKCGAPSGYFCDCYHEYDSD